MNVQIAHAEEVKKSDTAKHNQLLAYVAVSLVSLGLR